MSNLELPAGSVIAVDIDGTLAEIHPAWDEVQVHPDVPSLLDRLAARHKVIVNTGSRAGRARALVRAKRPLVIGLGGLQRDDGGVRSTHPLAEARRNDLAAFRHEIRRWPELRALGMKIEDRDGLVFAVHWRVATDYERAEEVAERISAEARADRPDRRFAVKKGRLALDIRPIELDKGGALAEVVATLDPRPPAVLSMGDDLSDAVAHDAVIRLVADELVPRGVIVGVKSSETPDEILRVAEKAATVENVAGFLLDGVDDAVDLLRQLDAAG